MSRSTYLTPKRSNCRSVTWKFQPRKPRKQHRHNRTPAVNARINVRHEESIPQLCLAAVECQYKTEVIEHEGPWNGPADVEVATLEWVHWFNHHRLLEPIGDIPPAEFEQAYYQHSQAIA